MENCSKKPRLVDTPIGQVHIKEEVTDNETTRVVVVNNAAPPVAKMTIETEKSMYDCSLCGQPLKPPVLECRAGHGACGNCAKDHDNKCHLCADCGEYSHIPSLDRYVMAAKVSCPNEPFGCRTLVPYCLVQDHYLECPDAPCYCPEPVCSFRGSPQMLCHHLQANHDWLVTTIVFDEKLDLEIDEVECRRLLAAENREHLFLLVIREEVGRERKVRLVRVRGKDAGQWLWGKMWTNNAIYGGMKPVTLCEDWVRSCAEPSEAAAIEVSQRYLTVQPNDMHPGGGFSLRVRIRKPELQTAAGAAAAAHPVPARAD